MAIIFEPNEKLTAQKLNAAFAEATSSANSLAAQLAAPTGAGLVGFQAPTGVPRTVGSKLSDLALSPEDFGAVGNGTTDDTVALQTWLNQLTVGKVGLLSPGKVYGFSNLTLPSPLSYTGTGPNGARTYSIVINGQNAVLKKISAGDPVYGIASTQWLNNVNGINSPVHIYDLNVDLNGFATTAGVITQHFNSLFERVNVFNAVGHGFMQAGAVRNGTIVTSSLNNNNWVQCDFYQNGGSGFYLNSPGLNNNADGILQRCRAFDNVAANVKMDIVSGWDIIDLHCFNNVVAQADLGVTVFGACNTTRFIGCEFDLDGSNTATPSCYITGGTTATAASFGQSYFLSPLVIANPQSFRINYSLSGCFFKNTFLRLNDPFISVSSAGTQWSHPTPVLSNVAVASPNPSIVMSSVDYWETNNVRLDGQHLLTKGAVAPFSGGYSYLPIRGHSFNVTPSGGTFTMGFSDSLLQFFAVPLTANITVQLPPKASISDFQKPFVFQRQTSSTGAFNINITDVDTGFTIAQLTTAGTYQNIIFDGTAWQKGGSGVV